jgi:ankyrin repeat protein
MSAQCSSQLDSEDDETNIRRTDEFPVTEKRVREEASSNNQQEPDPISDETYVLYAALDGDAEAIQYWIQKGGDVNMQINGRGRLHYAAITARGFEIVRVLLDNHADANIRDQVDHSPLYYAMFHKHLKTIRLLLDHGADVNDLEVASREPLHALVINPYFDDKLFKFWQLLLDADAKIHAGDLLTIKKGADNPDEKQRAEYSKLFDLCLQYLSPHTEEAEDIREGNNN